MPRFQTDVLDRSKDVAVVVDLWAPWCGPCTQLGPILEKVVDETDGQVELAKVNVDENPQIGQAFQVQSIPAVYALKDGAGGRQLHRRPGRGRRAGLRRRPAPERDRGRSSTPCWPPATRRRCRRRSTLVPDDERVIVALADLWVTDGRRTTRPSSCSTRIPESPETRRVAALARTGEAVVDGDEVSGRLDGLLDRVKDDDDARQEYVDLLELLGPDDPRTAPYRKALSQRLF